MTGKARSTGKGPQEQCPLIGNCPSDKPTRVASLGCRFLITLISWGVLANGVSAGSGYFTSSFLFALTLLADYWRFIPDTIFRRWLRAIGLVYAGLCLAFAFFGLVGIIEVVNVNNTLTLIISNNFLIGQGSSCALKYIWVMMGVGVVLTGVDWLSYSGVLEKHLMTQSKQRGVEA